MKYCPNRACEHRKRTGQPAEFVDDERKNCSDCGTPLVAADADELIYGSPRGEGPYRRQGGPREPAGDTLPSQERKPSDVAVGLAFILGGIALTAITYSAAASGGSYIVAYGPICYGLYRLFRPGGGRS